jgi:adenosylhomocysteine nucleosidase
MQKDPVIAILAIAIIVSSACAVGFAIIDSESGDKIGIIGAMDSEVNSLKDSMHIERRETIASMEFCIGTLDGKAVVVCQCGMGKVNAGICASTMIHNYNVKKIINTGVAGSLSDDLEIGDIVISVSATQHDFDVSPIGFEEREIPYTGLSEFPADATLIAGAEKAVTECAPEIGYLKGLVCSGDQFIDTVEKKNAILAKCPDGLCCEMEGGAIAQTCHLYDTPFVILRCVSDKPDGSGAADYEEFEKQAAKRCAAIVHYMIRICC